MDIPQFRRGETLTAKKLNDLAQSIAAQVASVVPLSTFSTQLPGVAQHTPAHTMRERGKPEILMRGENPWESCAGATGIYVIPPQVGAMIPEVDYCKLPFAAESVGSGEEIYAVIELSCNGAPCSLYYTIEKKELVPPSVFADPEAPGPAQPTVPIFVGKLKADSLFSCNAPTSDAFYIEQQNVIQPPHWLVTPKPKQHTELPCQSREVALLRCRSPYMQSLPVIAEGGGIVLSTPNTCDHVADCRLSISSGLEIWCGDPACSPCAEKINGVHRPGCVPGYDLGAWRRVASLPPTCEQPGTAGCRLPSMLSLEAIQHPDRLWQIGLKLTGRLLALEEAPAVAPVLSGAEWTPGVTVAIPGSGEWEYYPIHSHKDISSVDFQSSTIDDERLCTLKIAHWWAVDWLLLSPDYPGRILFSRSRSRRTEAGKYCAWCSYPVDASFSPLDN